MKEISELNDYVEFAEKKNIGLGYAALLIEVERSMEDAEELSFRMGERYKIMQESAEKGLAGRLKSISGLSGGNAVKLNGRSSGTGILSEAGSNLLSFAMAIAEVNACMGCIVAAPTAGSCGILPAVLIAMDQIIKPTMQQIINALFAASAVGIIIDLNATLSGAEGGCQAECGSAAAMAAAAAVDMAGGNAKQSSDAAALALKNMLGLVCDPVGGLVEVPCVKRNSFAAMHAVVAAELALAGIESVIPFDEVVMAMAEISRRMPSEYKETACGGLAVTPTGIRCAEKLL